MKKYRDLTPEEQWEITDNLTPQDIMNGMVDHYLNDNVFWRDVEYEHPVLLSFLDNRFAIINKEYGLEKLHHLSKHHPRKKWEQSIAWCNFENNQNTNENKNMKQNKIKITENELKQIVAESVKKVLNENTDENYEIKQLLTNLYGWTQFYEKEFDKANISDRSGGKYSMWGALREMQGIIGRLYDLCLKSNPSDRAL
jgi:hypothetical protein